ncbi:DUF835 domain-containing protein, partial [archaeon]|nr:DUF835 domain-containing protein [archaeon]
NFFNGIKIGSKGSIWVIDSQGKYITEPIEEWKEISKKTNYFSWVKENYPKNSDFINEMIAESSGTIIEDWENYGKTITAYTHFMIGSKEWILGISTPYSELKEDIVSLNNKMFYFMLSTLGILSISFIFILLLLRSQEKTESKLKRVEVTLKEFGIESILETTTNGKIDIELNPNNIYLLKEKNDSYAAELFVSTLNKGYAGLGMTRDNPKLIKEKFKLEKTPFIWLKKSKNKSDKSSLVNVKDLQKIMFDFMNHGKSVILIERFDYIITQNEFKSSLNFLQSLRDVVMIKDSIIIISLNPNSLNDKELNLIESECKDISNIIIKEKPKLPKDIFDILIFIFKMNDSGKVIYFKTISKEFNITKPTTSKKILELKNYGFIEIEKHGRVKSVLITDVGREFIK